MVFAFEAACGSDRGKVRANNEDCVCLEGNCLDQNSCDLHTLRHAGGQLKFGACAAVFDGMGGENFGEEASMAAASAFLQKTGGLRRWLLGAKQGYLKKLAFRLNGAVLEKMRALSTEWMGTTMVSLHFGYNRVYICNIGDSRAYRLRSGELTQLSIDHVQKIPGRKKTPLTQHLGIDPEYMVIEPYVAHWDLRKGDQYLLCSDGLTDMLTDPQIAGILSESENAEAGVRELLQAALDNGGRDNVSVVVYRILE